MLTFLKESLGGTDAYVTSFISKRPWLKESLLAIALHNREHSIKFSEYPIAFLLKLCDELQEWDRKTFYKENIKPGLFDETGHIKLGCFSYKVSQDKYELSEGENGKGRLSVIFEYRDPAKLAKTGWNSSMFENAKKAKLLTCKFQGLSWKN